MPHNSTGKESHFLTPNNSSSISTRPLPLSHDICKADFPRLLHIGSSINPYRNHLLLLLLLLLLLPPKTPPHKVLNDDKDCVRKLSYKDSTKLQAASSSVLLAAAVFLKTPPHQSGCRRFSFTQQLKDVVLTLRRAK
jgi:hypothetical protein